MNLIEQKRKIETKIKNIVKSNIQADVTVGAELNINTGDVLVTLNDVKEAADGKMIYHYDIVYQEKNQALSIAAFQRYIQEDAYGPSLVISTAINLDEAFFNSMKNIIAYALTAEEGKEEADKEAEAN